METYGLTVEAQQMYLELIGREQNGAGTPHVSQDELETWEVRKCFFRYKQYDDVIPVVFFVSFFSLRLFFFFFLSGL